MKWNGFELQRHSTVVAYCYNFSLTCIRLCDLRHHCDVVLVSLVCDVVVKKEFRSGNTVKIAVGRWGRTGDEKVVVVEHVYHSQFSRPCQSFMWYNFWLKLFLWPVLNVLFISPIVIKIRCTHNHWQHDVNYQRHSQLNRLKRPKHSIRQYTYLHNVIWSHLQARWAGLSDLIFFCYGI